MTILLHKTTRLQQTNLAGPELFVITEFGCNYMIFSFFLAFLNFQDQKQISDQYWKIQSRGG